MLDDFVERFPYALVVLGAGADDGFDAETAELRRLSGCLSSLVY